MTLGVIQCEFESRRPHSKILVTSAARGRPTARLHQRLEITTKPGGRPTVSTPTNDPNPFGTPAPPGQAPLPGQFGAAGAQGPGYPATPEQSMPTQTAPVYGGQPDSQYAPYVPPGGAPGPGPQFGPGGMQPSGPVPGGMPGPMPGPGSMPPPYGYGYPPPKPTVTSAVAIVALCLFWVPVAGLVLSIIGMVKTAKGKARGRGLAIAALVLSILVTLGAVLVGAAIASKPSALDPGCTRGKTAVLEQSKQIDADSAKGDTTAVQNDLGTLVDDLAKAASESKRSDVRATVQAVHDDYAAIAGGQGNQGKLASDLQQMDHLCTIGK